MADLKLLILADESSHWVVAGLTQLERLTFALNELAEATGATADVVISWRSEIPLPTGQLPNAHRTPCVRISEFYPARLAGWRIITTRLFVGRDGLGQFLTAAPPVRFAGPGADESALYREFEASCRNREKEVDWSYLVDAADIEPTERRFLRGAGKPQDGAVSRFINRPLSRPLTRLLLRFPVTPTGWTLTVFALSVLSGALALRGNYLGILLGALLYQIASMLDGCDGEIARAKYLESKRGGQIDSFCDLVGGFVFMLGLGFGLARAGNSVTYALEAILLVLLTATNELLLSRLKHDSSSGSSYLSGALYPRHQQLIEGSGVLVLGERFVWWILQLTKRDVLILFYLILAAIGLAPWILHVALVLVVPGLLLTSSTRLTQAKSKVGTGPRS